MRPLLVTALLLCAFRAAAVDADSTRRFGLYAVQQFGMAFGEKSNSFVLNMSGGVAYKNRLKAGIGAAFNMNYVRTMPLYVDLRYEPFRSKVRPVVFAAGGLNVFPTYSANSDVFYYYNDEIVKRQVGTYAEAGIGFKTKLAGNVYYNTSFGYIYKKSRYVRKGQERWENGTWVIGVDEPTTAENYMFAIRAGLDF